LSQRIEQKLRARVTENTSYALVRIPNCKAFAPAFAIAIPQHKKPDESAVDIGAVFHLDPHISPGKRGAGITFPRKPQVFQHPCTVQADDNFSAAVKQFHNLEHVSISGNIGRRLSPISIVTGGESGRFCFPENSSGSQRLLASVVLRTWWLL
jgi:hypothetical protein